MVTTASIRLGTLEDAAMATVAPGGVLELEGARVRWWLRGDDRWHDPARTASLRERRVDGVAVVESTIRVPSGDVRAVAAATVWSGGPTKTARPVIVLQVHNPTSNPVAVAFVVESTRGVGVDGNGLDDGVVRVQVGRPARAGVGAPDAESLFELISESDPQDVSDVAGVGAGAVILPVPHLTSATAVISCGAERVDEPEAVAALADQVGLGAERVVAGWLAVLERAPRLDWGDSSQLERWRSSVSESMLGPITVENGELIAVIVGLARCGLLDETDRWVDLLLGRQRSNGSMRGDDPVVDTVGLLQAARAMWIGGLEPSFAEQLVGPVAAAIEWLTAGRRRRQVEAAGAVVADGYAAVVPFLAAQGQPEIAEELAREAGRLGWAGLGAVPAARGTVGPRSVADQLDGVVAETTTGLDLGRAWSLDLGGRPLSMQGVPTRWGRVSWALRWHGARPALLWELEPWAHRELTTPPRWRASSIDPDWTGSDVAGEALLAAPRNAVPDAGTIS